jgi:hypothetical protein
VKTIPMNKSILIVCEGQTEALYFKSFPMLGVRVDAVNLKGQSKLKMVEYHSGNIGFFCCSV